MFAFVTVIHIVVSLFLVVVVLLQSGKAADLAGAFGGMGSQTVFGPRGSATVLTRATTISAIVFMVTSLALSVLSNGAGAGGSNPLEQFSKPAAGEKAAPVGNTSAPAGDTAAPGTGDIKVIPQGDQGGQPAIPVEITPTGKEPAAK